MEKIIKRIIWIFGIAFVGVVLVANILCDSRLSNDLDEHITISVMQISSFVITGLVLAGLYFLLKKVPLFEKMGKKIRIGICIAALIAYLGAQVIWINYRQATPAWDSKAVYTMAVDMYEGNSEAISKSEYATKNPHQLPLAFMESLVFRVIGDTSPKALQYINAFCNVAIIMALGFIAKEILNKSKFVAMVIGMLFVSIALLATFIYGDLIGLAFALWSVFFLMKYNKKEKWYFALISAVLIALAMIFRKNMLIFMAAEVIYLFINIITKKPKIKKILIDIGIIIAFVLISIIPSKVIISVIQNKYNLNNDDQIPTTTYLYIGMTDGYRGSGWYNDYAHWVWENPIPEAKKMYSEAIGERVKELITHPFELIKFYTKKNVSMYTENTYAALFYNGSYNFEEESKNLEKDEFVISQQDRLQLFQKALVILIFGCTLILIIKNRKNLSNDELLLLIIFMGGFIFHNIWEAKSRYVIPYLIILIPLASKYLATIKRKEKNDEENISNSTSI